MANAFVSLSLLVASVSICAAMIPPCGADGACVHVQGECCSGKGYDDGRSCDGGVRCGCLGNGERLSVFDTANFSCCSGVAHSEPGAVKWAREICGPANGADSMLMDIKSAPGLDELVGRPPVVPAALMPPVEAGASTLKLAWNDCGDSSTHTKITGFSPSAITTGQTATMIGTGNLDEDVPGANFDLEMNTLAGKVSCKGDASQSKTCHLPLGVGSLTFNAMSFPIKKGSTSVSVDLALSAMLPGALAHTETKVTATAAGGDQLFCMDIKSAPALDELVGRPPVATNTSMLEAPEAQCNAADTTKWNGDAGHAQWQKDMTSCGTKCLGRASCVSSCMAGDGWSTGCAGCFGDLAGCTASHCLMKCMGGRSPGCVTCLKSAGCDTAAFGSGSCTGLDAPSTTEFVGQAQATASQLKLTWNDCGDSSTHTKITGFSPSAITTGQTATMIGTGNLDEDVSGANFDLEMNTLAGKVSCKGDASQSKTCHLPLGVGSLTFNAMSFPIKKGSTSVSVDLALSAMLPGALAHTETKVTATAAGGDQLFCMDIKSAPAVNEVVIV